MARFSLECGDLSPLCYSDSSMTSSRLPFKSHHLTLPFSSKRINRMTQIRRRLMSVNTRRPHRRVT